MVEMIVVMLVLGVLSAVALPRMTDRSALQERGAQEQLRGMLAYSRKLAVTQQRDVCVLLTPTRARAVYATGSPSACLPGIPVAAPGETSPYLVDAPLNVNFGGATQVQFNARGQPAATTNQTITVGTLSLTVQRETGFTLLP
jgi:MSHA pilin protein MshC